MSDTREYTLPLYIQYAILTIIMFGVSLYMFVTTWISPVTVLGFGASVIFGAISWVAHVNEEPPLTNGNVRQLIGGYVVIALIYIGILVLT